MPSFDIVSELNQHEVTNGVDQASREVDNRFDFRGSDAKFELKDKIITLSAQSEFQLKQMLDILKARFAKRGIDTLCMEIGDPVTALNSARQTITMREGIDAELGKKVQRLIKDSKVKVQAQMQDQQIRVTGKNRDDLQAVIAMVRRAELGMPMQFTNFRD